MDWFSLHSSEVEDDLFRRLNDRAHVWAKNTFANQFARGGGMLPVMFPGSRKRDALKAAFRRKHAVGSDAHLNNLLDMMVKDPNNKRLQKLYLDAKASRGAPVGKLGKVLGKLGTLAGVGMVAIPLFTTPGGLEEKGKATAGGIASLGGWALGSRLGAGIGSAVGGPVGAVLGYVAGGIIGAVAADEGTQALLGVPSRLVDRERKRRKLDWVGDKTAFQTQRAATMRQQSMAMMNSGMMSARSMLGREGVMLHQ